MGLWTMVHIHSYKYELLILDFITGKTHTSFAYL